jgi:hypothetical protein
LSNRFVNPLGKLPVGPVVAPDGAVLVAVSEATDPSVRRAAAAA